MTRYIDADALKKSLDEHVYLVHHGFNETEYGCTQYGIHQIIDEAQTIDAEPHWIPCSERLPEEETDVLICNSTGDIAISRGSYRTEASDWIWYTSGWRFGEVIAWMPLPEPYEVKDE